jgi:hypothetical protein
MNSQRSAHVASHGLPVPGTLGMLALLLPAMQNIDRVPLTHTLVVLQGPTTPIAALW